MRMFGYYALHTIINQIRKLLKTWVLIFILACALIGGLIGFGTAVFMEHNVPEIPEEFDELEESTEIEEFEEEELTILGQAITSTKSQIAESVAAIAVLGMLVLFVAGAEKGGGKIFLMADVNLLFASPMKPQSVLLFRLMTKLGLWLFLSAYLGICYTPMLLDTGNISSAGIVILFIAWFFALAYCQLLQILFYILSTNHPNAGKRIRLALISIGVVFLAAFFFYWKRSQLLSFDAAISFLSSRFLSCIPVWGWIKGTAGAAFGNDYLFAAGLILVMLLGLLLLVAVIWRMKTDFYEDAMKKSEEVAELQRSMKEGRGTFGAARLRRTQKAETKIKTKKKRDIISSGKYDGFTHGWGASTLFFKAMHIRFRFARFHVLTKTMGTYLMAAAGAIYLNQTLLPGNGFLAGMFLLGVMNFYRALGNPVEEDTSMDLFRMIPERASAKLFYSLLGVIANCFLDLIPAVLVIMIGTKTSAVTAFSWLLVILTINIYSTCTGAFIGISVPVSAGTTIKQMVQVLFVYFGLLPDIVIFAIGYTVNRIAFSAMIASVVNLLLSLAFFALIPQFLEPHHGSIRRVMNDQGDNLKSAKRVFSRIGFAALAFMLLGSAAQIIVMEVFVHMNMDVYGDTLMWLGTFLPIYLIGFPCGYLILKKLPTAPPDSLQKFSSWNILLMFPICIFMAYTGNIIGSILQLALQNITGGTGSVNVLENYAGSESLLLKVLFMAVLAPAIEEFFFRKCIIDRVLVYGEKNAILFSAMIFGLFHGNLTQTMYAIAIGLVLGYLYVRSGKLRNSILLHMLINFIASVVSGSLVLRMSEDLELIDGFDDFMQVVAYIDKNGIASVRGLLYFGIYLVFIAICFLLGIVFLLMNLKKIQLKETELQLPYGKAIRTMWLNPGMILYTIGMIGMITYVLIQVLR